MSRTWSVNEIAELLRNVPDFPKPGIMFKDFTPILENADAFKSLAQHLKSQVYPGTTKLLAIESRGFILAAAVAQYLDAGVVLARKPGKLPRATTTVTYNLEYGTDSLQIHTGSLTKSDRVTIVDDLLATGGTAHAAESLAIKSGAEVLGSCFMMELTGLNGGKRLANPYNSLMKL